MQPLIDDRLRAELSALYSGPDRHYHGLAHIEALLALADEYRAAISDPGAVEAAIWFHDAIYDSRAADNEAKSAALAVERLTGMVDGERLARIAAMIEATATHVVPVLGEEVAGNDAALFLDMDLSILGASPEAFDAYESAVRREYGWVSDEAWRLGRAAVLGKFLDRPAIFHSQPFRDRFETTARENIARSIARLRGG